jgi:homospermidine synthase
VRPALLDRGRRVLLLGAHGGVGQAVRALLAHSVPGRKLRAQLDALVLVDGDAPGSALVSDDGNLTVRSVIGSADDLAWLVREHGASSVVDLSSLDTVDCTRTCDSLGCHFLSTSVEEWPWRGSMPTDEAIARLLPPFPSSLGRRSHLVGSGANPGIVNALVFAALEAFSERAGVAPSVDALALQSILITEEDTTSAPATRSDVFSMTWHPEHCLEELFEPRAFVARDGRVVGLGPRPTERHYEARCGDHLIEGFMVPHEETVTLATRLANIEIGFVYRIPPGARAALAAHPERSFVAGWPTRRLYPPFTTDLTGYDRLGVLLCSHRFGELWMGFHTDVTAGLALNTNATQLQVAAGVVAGMHQLGSRRGVHFVEDLDWRDFLDVVSEALGPPVVVHAPTAPVRPIIDRARDGSFAQREPSFGR